MGSTVRRLFEDGKMYEGVVAPFDGDYYTVEYTDGDKVRGMDSHRRSDAPSREGSQRFPPPHTATSSRPT